MSLTDQLSNKNILFFCVKTFNYELEIKSRMEKYGANVFYFDERPSDSHLIRGLIRLKKSFYQHRINSYYERILGLDCCSSVDYLLVVRGEVVPAFFLEEIKRKNPFCTLIYYTWDSFSNHPYPKNNLKFYDRSFTFDKSDSIDYNLVLRPLFFISDYEELERPSIQSYENSVLFIGTAHSDRYLLSQKIKNRLNEYGRKMFCFYFMHSKWVYWYSRLFVKGFLKAKFNELSFTSLSKDEILKLYKSSFAILDIQHPNQTGLTMRTFETLGSGRKLVTTNSNIKDYSFYNPNNIYIIDREGIDIENAFFNTPFLDYDSSTVQYMSIDGWLNDLFRERQNIR